MRCWLVIGAGVFRRFAARTGRAGPVPGFGVGEPAGEFVAEVGQRVADEGGAVFGGCFGSEVVTNEFRYFVGSRAVLAIAVAGDFFPLDDFGVSGVAFTPGADGLVDAGEVAKRFGGRLLVIGWGSGWVLFFGFMEVLVRVRVNSLPVILSCTPFLGTLLFPCCFPVVSPLLSELF